MRERDRGIGREREKGRERKRGGRGGKRESKVI